MRGPASRGTAVLVLLALSFIWSVKSQQVRAWGGEGAPACGLAVAPRRQPGKSACRSPAVGRPLLAALWVGMGELVSYSTEPTLMRIPRCTCSTLVQTLPPRAQEPLGASAQAQHVNQIIVRLRSKGRGPAVDPGGGCTSRRVCICTSGEQSSRACGAAAGVSRLHTECKRCALWACAP